MLPPRDIAYLTKLQCQAKGISHQAVVQGSPRDSQNNTGIVLPLVVSQNLKVRLYLLMAL